MFVILFIILVGLTLFANQNTLSVTARADELPRTAKLVFYYKDNNSAKKLDDFLLNLSDDAKIEVVYELEYDTTYQNDIKNSINTFMTKVNVNSTLAQQRLTSKEFHKSKNLDFLDKQDFNMDSSYYRTVVSDYSRRLFFTTKCRRYKVL